MPGITARLSRALGKNCYSAIMATVSTELAGGPGWRVCDVVCDSGPGNRPFEERHASACVALVTAGSFQYRCRQGSAMLTPGALLLGEDGACFECGHEHATGDRCLSFHYAPEFLETVARHFPGVRTGFSHAHVPPLPALVPLAADAIAARDDRDGLALEEAAYRFAVAALAIPAGLRGAGRTPSRHDERRVTRAVRHIDDSPGTAHSLASLARVAAMSPCHFLRVFRQTVGLTPHRYVLRMRLQRAALRLARSGEPVSTIAFEEGFSDLSTFNRRFHAIMRMSPGRYRAQRHLARAA